MSWNCAIAVVEGAAPAELAGAGLRPVDGTVLADFVLTADTSAVGYPGAVFAAAVPSGTVLLGDMLDVLGLAPVLAPVLGRTVRLAVFGGTSDSHLWQVTAPGGPLRELRSQEGQIELDDGEPDTAEAAAGIGPLTEDSLVELLQRTTGVALDDALISTETTPYVRDGDVSGPGDPASGQAAPAPRRRSLMDRLRRRR